MEKEQSSSFDNSKPMKKYKAISLVLGVIGLGFLGALLFLTADKWLKPLAVAGCVVAFVVYACYKDTRQTQQQVGYYRQDFANRLMLQLRQSCFTIFEEVAHIVHSLKVSNIDMLNNLLYLYSNNSLLFALTIPKAYLSKDDKVADSTIAYINARLEALCSSYNTQIVLCDNTMCCPLFYITNIKDNGTNVTLYFVLKNWGDGGNYAKSIDDARLSAQARTVAQDKVTNDDFR